MEHAISIILTIALIYLLMGVLFAFAFLSKGMQKLDKDTKNTNIFFKLLILPGVIFFWIVLLLKWMKIKNFDD